MKFVFYKNCLLLKIIYTLTLIPAFIQANGFMDVVMVIVACVLPFVFPVLFKLVHKKMPNEMMCLNITFIYFASLIGSCLGGYKIIFFDKVVHFASGFIAFTIGLLLYEGWVSKRINRNNFKLFFCNLFNLSVAVIWEFYEYFMLVVFDHDCINHYSSGVHDALTDMFCAFVGGLIVTIIIYYSNKKEKPNFFEDLVQSFYLENNELSDKG